jgi:hypothetical protein
MAILSACSTIASLSTAVITPHVKAQTQDPFKRYKTIEAYEVRPGILMMPRYASDGKLCEIGLERRRYSPDVIRHDSDLSRKEINEIADELAPTGERGAKTDLGEMDRIAGHGIQIVSDYENVTIEIHYWILPSGPKEYTLEQPIAVIRWKHRQCQ